MQHSKLFNDKKPDLTASCISNGIIKFESPPCVIDTIRESHSSLKLISSVFALPK